jgi:pyruvate dehydrogenase complex dehydrogenase (E1) component
MSVPADVLRRANRFGLTPPSPSRDDLLRALFRVGMREQAAKFSQWAATLAALNENVGGDATSRKRAMAALRMYCAREAMDEIEDALVQIGDGTSPMRRHRGLDEAHVVVTALRGLAQRGDVNAQVVDAALQQFGIDLAHNA